MGIKLGFGPVPITIAFMILLSLGPFQQVGAASATIITATQAKIPVNISVLISKRLERYPNGYNRGRGNDGRIQV